MYVIRLCDFFSNAIDNFLCFSVFVIFSSVQILNLILVIFLLNFFLNRVIMTSIKEE